MMIKNAVVLRDQVNLNLDEDMSAYHAVLYALFYKVPSEAPGKS